MFILYVDYAHIYSQWHFIKHVLLFQLQIENRVFEFQIIKLFLSFTLLNYQMQLYLKYRFILIVSSQVVGCLSNIIVHYRLQLLTSFLHILIFSIRASQSTRHFRLIHIIQRFGIAKEG